MVLLSDTIRKDRGGCDTPLAIECRNDDDRGARINVTIPKVDISISEIRRIVFDTTGKAV